MGDGDRIVLQGLTVTASLVQCMVFRLVGVSGAEGRAYRVWWIGEGWVCSCLERQSDDVSCI